jgi:hypothetical protein
VRAFSTTCDSASITSTVSKFHVERFNLKKLQCRGKEQFCVEVSNRFAAWEGFDAEVEINSAWEQLERI